MSCSSFSLPIMRNLSTLLTTSHKSPSLKLSMFRDYLINTAIVLSGLVCSNGVWMANYVLEHNPSGILSKMLRKWS